MDSRFLSLECDKVHCYDFNECNKLLVIVLDTLDVVIVDLISASFRCKFKIHEIYTILSTSAPNNHNMTKKKSNMNLSETYYRKNEKFSLPLHVLKSERKKIVNFSNNNDNNSNHNSFMGEIHAVKFIDRKSMNCIFGENYTTKIVSDHRIMIVCDNAVLIYDYILRTGYTISTIEIGKSINYAEFISHSILAIGCNDGSIAFMHSSDSQPLLKIYHSYSKSMITFMRLCSYQTYDSSANCSRDTNIFRLLVIQQDGAAYIWEGYVNSNYVDIHKNQPSLQLKDSTKNQSFFVVPVHKLSTSLLFNYSHIDELTNSLITITSDRMIRMWTLDNNGSDVPNMSTKSNSSNSVSRIQRLSFFSSLLNRNNISKSTIAGHGDTNEDTRDRSNSNISSNSTTSEIDRNSANTSSNLSTIIGNKHTLQTFGDNTAIRRAIDTSVSDLICYERISYGKKDVYSKFSACVPIYSMKYPTGTYLLANKVNSNLLFAVNNVRDNFSDRNSENNVNTFFLDPLHEINLLSLLQPYSVITASNHTIKVMFLRTIRSFPELIYVGTNVGILLLNINTLAFCSGPSVGTHKEWGPIHLCYSNSSIQKTKIAETYAIKSDGVNNINNINNIESIGDDSKNEGATNIITIVVIEELSCHVSDTFIKSSPSKYTNGQSDSSSLSNNFLINRPIVLSSPSGKFCSFYWPQSCSYIIVAVNIALKSGPCMQEVERGQCTHFAWICDFSDQICPLHSDVFVTLRVKQNNESVKGKEKKTSFLNNLFSSDANFEHKTAKHSVSVTDFAFKYFPVDESSRKYDLAHHISISNSSEYFNINDIIQIHGGLLLCITTASLCNDSTITSKSKLLHLVNDIQGNQMLKQVGPSMPQITQVSWDYSTGYGALCIGDRINIVYLFINQSRYILQTIHSIGVESPKLNHRLWWDLGSLYICCGKVIFTACTKYPCENNRLPPTQYLGTRDVNIPLVDIYTISRSDCTFVNPVFINNKRSCNYTYNNEFQFVEVIDIRKGNLILTNSSTGTVFSLPLTGYPLASLTIMLNYGHTKDALEWSKVLPEKLHNNIANIFRSRGFLVEALSLRYISDGYIDETWRYRVDNHQNIVPGVKILDLSQNK